VHLLPVNAHEKGRSLLISPFYPGRKRNTSGYRLLSLININCGLGYDAHCFLGDNIKYRGRKVSFELRSDYSTLSDDAMLNDALQKEIEIADNTSKVICVPLVLLLILLLNEI
jgi:hypothetical protein